MLKPDAMWFEKTESLLPVKTFCRIKLKTFIYGMFCKNSSSGLSTFTAQGGWTNKILFVKPQKACQLKKYWYIKVTPRNFKQNKLQYLLFINNAAVLSFIFAGADTNSDKFQSCNRATHSRLTLGQGRPPCLF